jgi:hypothetical protein
LIYPPGLEVKETTDTASSASLDLYLEFDDSGQLNTTIYDKRDDFNFKILNFPNMCSNIPASPAYGVYISQLIRYARASSNYSDFLKRYLHLRNRLPYEAVSVVSLTSSPGGYINGRNSANLELLIDKTSSVYLYVKLKALAS